VAIDAAQFGNPTILQEPGIPVQQGYSDIFGIASGAPDGGLALAFASDTEQNLTNFGLFANVILEIGGPVDATMYLSADLRALGYTATFLSDVESVPLPAALPLFSTGVAALGLLGWRRRRKGAAVTA
jgi:hypothetical protein